MRADESSTPIDNINTAAELAAIVTNMVTRRASKTMIKPARLGFGPKNDQSFTPGAVISKLALVLTRAHKAVQVAGMQAVQLQTCPNLTWLDKSPLLLVWQPLR